MQMAAPIDSLSWLDMASFQMEGLQHQEQQQRKMTNQHWKPQNASKVTTTRRLPINETAHYNRWA